MTQLRVASVVLGLLLVAPGCSSGGDEDAEAPECPPVSTDGQPAGTTTTLDPRCVQAGEERDDSDDSDESEGEGVTWEGPISSTYTNVTPCMGSDQGTITVTVGGGKDVSGTVAASGSYTCPTELFTGTGAGTVTYGVTGTFTGDEFRLLWEPPFMFTGDATVSGCGAIEERPIVVPVTERGTAQASFEQAITGGQFTCQITLERQRDDEAVG